MKKFFELPMEKKLLVKASNFAFGYVGGSPVDWRYRWWMEGLHMRVRLSPIDGHIHHIFNAHILKYSCDSMSM